MTIGIYCLYFPYSDGKYYIGFASDLSNRLSKHKSLLKQGKHHSKKLQNYYNKYNILPNMYILEECLVSELPVREIYWINMFNSYTNGFNETQGGESVGFGENHPNSLYSNDIYIKVFKELINTNSTALDISKKYNISIEVVQDISSCSTHTYLKEQFPEEYRILETKLGNRISGKSCAKDKGITYPAIISPDNKKYNVDNTRQFARDFGLDQAALHRLLSYKAKSHKGWKRYGE